MSGLPSRPPPRQPLAQSENIVAAIYGYPPEPEDSELTASAAEEVSAKVRKRH